MLPAAAWIKVVDGQGEREDSVHSGSSSQLDLGQLGRGLDTAEHLLGTLAAALADRVADVARCAAIDRRVAWLAGLAEIAVDGNVRLTERDRNEATKSGTS